LGLLGLDAGDCDAAGTYRLDRGRIDASSIESMKIQFYRGRSYWSTTLGTLWLDR
jgi:hypothetical protein